VRIVFVHDDTVAVPRAISRIIGAAHFGDIVRRKQRLSDTIKVIVEANGNSVRISKGFLRKRKYSASHPLSRRRLSTSLDH
jgi:hypothetical protein